MRALIDGDIVAYRAACSAQDEEPWIAMSRADKTVQDILAETHATSYSLYLTGSSNFRRDLTETYKANRPDSRPVHWQSVRDFLVTQHKAEICEGCEADDYLGINQDSIGGSTVICSIDKDLLQIAGNHYNFVKKEFRSITVEEGVRNLYTQALVGDRSDNIIGIAGIGPVKAERAFSYLTTEVELYNVCRELYNDDERLHLNMKLLYIWRKPGDLWVPPTTKEIDHDEENSPA
jgi:5'-3' exonuclease